MTLTVSRSKVCHIRVLGPQISLGDALRSLLFQIIELFGFSIGNNGEFESFRKLKKSLKIRNSKFQKPKHSFLRTIGGKIQDMFELLAAIYRSSLLKLSLQLGPMLTKTKKEIVKIKIGTQFCEDH